MLQLKNIKKDFNLDTKIHLKDIEFEDGKNLGSCYLYYDDQLLSEEQAISHLQQDNFQDRRFRKFRPWHFRLPVPLQGRIPL